MQVANKFKRVNELEMFKELERRSIFQDEDELKNKLEILWTLRDLVNLEPSTNSRVFEISLPEI